ncbi:MAG: FkbM family methyltransferase [Bacteriovoracaceae bacterium]
MLVKKLPNLWQTIRYSKPYRFPLWLVNKFKFRSLDPSSEYEVNMRLGHKMVLRPTERYLQNVVVSRQYHDPDVYFVERLVPKGGVIVDIGANIGLYTCGFAQFLKHKDIKLYSIEAIQKNFDLLKKNIELNHFKNVEAFRFAVGEESGELTFYLPSKDFVGNVSGGNVFSESDLKKIESQEKVKEVVPLVRIDDWAIENSIERCDFLKIDIEGAEMFAFRGGFEFLKKTRPIIQCEYNKHWLDKQDLSLQSFVQFFKDMDYDVYVEKENVFDLIQEETFDFHLVDLLFVPREKKNRLEI